MNDKSLLSKAMMAHAASIPYSCPTEIHDSPCVHCPSTKGIDPETEDIKTWPKSQRMNTVFPCAWRNEKLCKGYCDSIGVTREDIK